MMMITEIQGHAFAKAIAAIRPDWDPAGILQAIRQVADRDPGAVLIAFARAARNQANRTPAVAALAGPHWHDPQAADGSSRHPSAVKLGDLCGECFRHSCACDPGVVAARRRWDARQGAPERTARGAALARQALVTARREAAHGDDAA